MKMAGGFWSKDVLSFNLSSPKKHNLPPRKKHKIHGEIIASAETASREAHVYSGM